MTSTNTVVSSRARSRCVASPLAAGAVILLAAACSTSSGTGPNPTTVQTLCGSFKVNQPDATTCASPGGEVKGASDSHCSMNGKQVAQVIAACPMGADHSGTGASDGSASTDASGSSGDDAGSGSAGPDDGTCGDRDYQPTLNNHSGSDDDCKYDVSWTSTPICETGNVYFLVTVKKRALADGGSAVGGDEPPMTGGTVSAEVTMNRCTVIAQNTTPPQNFVEDPAGSGTYKVGPVTFGQKGKWNLRFHFNECCNDGPTSLHGHAAFWVNVP